MIKSLHNNGVSDMKQLMHISKRQQRKPIIVKRSENARDTLSSQTMFEI